jgi:hypothetical protein
MFSFCNLFRYHCLFFRYYESFESFITKDASILVHWFKVDMRTSFTAFWALELLLNHFCSWDHRSWSDVTFGWTYSAKISLKRRNFRQGCVSLCCGSTLCFCTVSAELIWIQYFFEVADSANLLRVALNGLAPSFHIWNN